MVQNHAFCDIYLSVSRVFKGKKHVCILLVHLLLTYTTIKVKTSVSTSNTTFYIQSLIFTFSVVRCSVRRLPKILQKKTTVCPFFVCSHVQPHRNSTVNPLSVRTLLISFDRRSMQNIKTSVPEEFNILQTDVFKFCNRRLSDDIKRVQTVQRLNSILRRNPTRLYV